MLALSLLTGSIYGAYDGAVTRRQVELRTPYIGTPDWQQLGVSYIEQSSDAPTLVYGARALLDGSTYGVLYTGDRGRYHALRLRAGFGVVGRYRLSNGVVLDSDFHPAWTVQDKEQITWTPASDGAAWAVSDQELVRWTPAAAVSGWSVQDLEVVRWRDIGNAWQVNDQEIVRWQGTVSGNVGPGAWTIEDAESVRWFGTAGTATDCSTGDGVPGTGAGGGGATIRNFVY
jgi:hypothetical protein